MKLQLVEKNISDKIFWNYVKYQNSLSSAKDLIRSTEAKNEQLVNNITDGLIFFKERYY